MNVLFTSILLFLALSISAQTTIWEVDFETGYSDGNGTAQDNNTPSGADWLKSGSPNGYWQVESTNAISGSLSMTGRNTDATMTWESEAISISGYTNVTISFLIGEIGHDDNSNDRIQAYYNIDNAGNVEIDNGDGDGNFGGTTTLDVSGLSGSSVVLTATVFNSRNSEHGSIDNITVEGTVSGPVDKTSQGSGYALDFDGSNDYVSLGTSTILRPVSTVTVESWVYAHTAGTWVAIFGNLYDTGSDEAGYGLFTNSSTGNVMFWVQTVGGTTNGYGNYPQVTLPLNEWVHFAGTYDGTNMRLYMNGVLQDTDAKSGNIDYSTSPLDARIGQYYDDNESEEFNGVIDELRIWDVARSQTQIRDNMCQKLAGDESGLLAYYRMDNASGTSLSELTSNGLTGTLNNMNNTDWILSGAAIGDASTNLYTGAWAGQSVSLASLNNKGTFEVNSVTGNPDGMHVFRVDTTPNSTTGISPSLGSNDTYFGTFLVNGIVPTYSAEIDYTGYSDAISEEPNLQLNNRADNSGTTWTDLTALVTAVSNLVAEPLIISRREFMLSGSANPLPVELKEFKATPNVEEKSVDLFWITSSEINNDYFTVEKTTNLESFEEVVQVTGQGTTSEETEYHEKDFNPSEGISYYRLSQTDYDGKTEYFNLEKVLFDLNQNENDIHVELYPNPNNGHNMFLKIPNSETEEINVLVSDFIGKSYLTDFTVINQGDYSIVVIEMNQKLAAGSYMINVSVNGENHAHKLIVQ
ncbi:MAG: LamG-like jellyroll fold domain-containing protein [Salibacteraceae bacterium]